MSADTGPAVRLAFMQYFRECLRDAFSMKQSFDRVLEDGKEPTKRLNTTALYRAGRIKGRSSNFRPRRKASPTRMTLARINASKMATE